MAQSVLITGCSSGIGLAVAQGLHARGYRVWATARKAEDVAQLQAQGLQSTCLDLSDSQSIRRGVDTVLEDTGGQLYGLFNNGAYGQPGAVEDLSRAALQMQFEVNVFGTHELTTLVLAVMRRQGFGRIIQNSSVLGLVALAYRGAYNASKYALEGLSDTLRLELANTNIHVSLIEPGPIRSRFRANALAAFEQNVNPEQSYHKHRYQAMRTRLAAQGAVVPFTLGPEAVLGKVIHALESKRPKIRYYVTVPTYLLAALRRCLPYRWLDKVLLRV